MRGNANRSAPCTAAADMRARTLGSAISVASARHNDAGSCVSTSRPSTPCRTMSRRAGRRRGHHRHTARHRLDQHVAEPFVVRAQRKHVGARDVLPGILLKAAQDDRRVEAALRGCAPESPALRSPVPRMNSRTSICCRSSAPSRRSAAGSSSLRRVGRRRRSPAAATAARIADRAAARAARVTASRSTGLGTTAICSRRTPKASTRSSATPCDVVTIRSAAA